MANLDHVDPKLAEVIREASRQFPGYDVKIKSGYRPGDKRQHGKGKAIDVTLVDQKTGKAVPDYQNAKSFGLYEKFAQTVRQVQQTIAPELSNKLRWGGYFSGGKGKYGALDLMHFDLAGHIGMAGGSWEKGLNAAQRSIWGIGGNMGMGELLNPSRLPSSAPRPSPRPPSPLNAAPVGQVTRGASLAPPRPSSLTAAPAGQVQRMALPAVTRPAPQAPVSPAVQTAAYQQYAATRATAPAVPTTPVDPKIASAYAQYAQSRMAAPATPPAPVQPLVAPPAPILPTPPAVRLQPVPPPVLAPVQNYAPAPPAPPRLSATDVWNGSPGTAMSTGGNQVSGDQFGNVAVTNQYGATTVNNARGNQAFGSLNNSQIEGPLGGAIGQPSLGQSILDKITPSKAKVGTMAGAAMGSYAGGPLGAIIGGLIGRDLARGLTPGTGLRDLISGVRSIDTSNINLPGFGAQTAFARPQGGLAFPEAPMGGITNARQTNRSYEGMRDISPKAADAISKGKGGLY